MLKYFNDVSANGQTSPKSSQRSPERRQGCLESLKSLRSLETLKTLKTLEPLISSRSPQRYSTLSFPMFISRSRMLRLGRKPCFCSNTW